MMQYQWLRRALFSLYLLLAATAPGLASTEAGRPPLDQIDCAPMKPSPEGAVEMPPQPPCPSHNVTVDVIHIPPVVIFGDRLNPPRPLANKHDPEFRKYLKRVRKAIDHEKDYPFTAQQMRWEGSTLIKFTISPLGELLQTRIDRTSGFLILDEAAEMAVKKAFPVVPPEHLFDQPVEFKIPVMFELH